MSEKWFRMPRRQGHKPSKDPWSKVPQLESRRAVATSCNLSYVVWWEKRGIRSFRNELFSWWIWLITVSHQRDISRSISRNNQILSSFESCGRFSSLVKFSLILLQNFLSLSLSLDIVSVSLSLTLSLHIWGLEDRWRSKMWRFHAPLQLNCTNIEHNTIAKPSLLKKNYYYQFKRMNSS